LKEIQEKALKKEIIEIYQSQLLLMIEQFLGFTSKPKSLTTKTSKETASFKKSLEKNEEYEFKSFKEYESSDDSRRIKWNLFAKYGQLYIRENTGFKQQEFIFVFDTSGSMLRKKQRSLEIIYFLLDLLSRKKKELKIFFLHGVSSIKEVLELSQKKLPQEKILKIFKNLEFGGESDLYQLLKSTDKLIKKKRFGCNTVILISDLIEKPGLGKNKSWLHLLKTGYLKNSQFLIFKLFKRLDYQIPNLGKIRIKDPETNCLINLDFSKRKIRDAYQQHALGVRSEFFNKILKYQNLRLCELNSDLQLSRCFNFEVNYNSGL